MTEIPKPVQQITAQSGLFVVDVTTNRDKLKVRLSDEKGGAAVGRLVVPGRGVPEGGRMLANMRADLRRIAASCVSRGVGAH